MSKDNRKSKNYYGNGSKWNREKCGYGNDENNDLIRYPDILLICDGDIQAFGKVVKKYQNYALSCAKGIAADFQRISDLRGYDEDIVQGMWEKLREKIVEKFPVAEDKKDTESHFNGFIKKSIRYFMMNSTKSIKRKFNREDCEQLDEAMDCPDPRFMGGDDGCDIRIWVTEISVKDKRLLEVLTKGLDALKDRHKMVLELAYVEDYPHEAIARLMKLTKKSVDNYLSEAIGILRSYKNE